MQHVACHFSNHARLWHETLPVLAARRAAAAARTHMILAGLKPAICGSEDQRLVHYRPQDLLQNLF